ncbi:MAG: hypothetical protein Q9170_003053 [Blastenia crenularia]
MSRPDILVHAAAPSHGSDDARYRKEALGTLGFEAVKRYRILHRDKDGEDDSNTIHDTQPVLNQDSITSTDPAPRQHLINALSTWATPVLSRPSPRLLVGRTPAPSFVENPPALLSNLEVKRTPADQQRPRTAPSGPLAIQETPHLRRSLSDSFETPPSIVPDSQPTASLVTNGKRPFEESSSPSPTHQQRPNAKKRILAAEAELEAWTQPEDTSTPPLNSLPQTSPSSPSPPPRNIPTPTTSTTNYQNQSPIHIYRRRQALPPRPKYGRGSFSTHLTPSLQILQERATTFLKTVKPLRPISALERGHWHFSIPSDDEKWNHAAREQVWAHLKSFVEGGQAGWGVWAIFEEGSLVGSDGAGIDGEKEAPMGNADDFSREGSGVNGSIKVYCWGEIVAEIYTVLVVSTRRNVKRCGAKWIDAAGEVVVDMGIG